MKVLLPKQTSAERLILATTVVVGLATCAVLGIWRGDTLVSVPAIAALAAALATLVRSNGAKVILVACAASALTSCGSESAHPVVNPSCLGVCAIQAATCAMSCVEEEEGPSHD